jgi:GrpB-like predicted nucleotidyltransferase (UPF0157 family)
MSAQAEPVVIVDYDPAWPTQFEALARRAEAALGGLAERVEHVGSTAVPGLAAKPVIDLDVVVAAGGDVPEAVRRLQAIGYRHQGDLGIRGREAFRQPPDEPRHHLYVCPRESPALAAHLQFRDHVRAHPDVAREYAALKRALAHTHGADRDAYTDAKTAFVVAALRDAGAG